MRLNLNIYILERLGTWKWFGLATAYGLILAWLVALIIYQGGKLLGFGG